MTVKLIEDIVEVLRQIVAELSSDPRLLEQLKPDDDMMIAGMDLPRIGYLVARVEQAYAVKFEDQELSLAPPITLAAIAACILHKTGVMSYCMAGEHCESSALG
jgi:aryl carrier-like protein